MARADTRTLLPLDTFAKYVGISPLHFNQVQVAELAPSRFCGDTFLQFSWQTADRVGREELAEAIADAEQRIADQLHYALAPRWVKRENLSYPRPRVPEGIFAGTRDFRGFSNTIKLDEKFILVGGAEAWTLLASAVPITYTDTDGDGYFETASVTLATSITDPEELALVYPTLDTSWEIRPIVVNIAAGIATITFRREQAVIYSALMRLDSIPVDGLNAAMFLDEIDVYRHWNDPSQQVNLIFDDIGWCSCNGVGCESCGYVVQTGCLTVRDSRVGLASIQAAIWDAVTQEYTFAELSECRAPDRLRLWYKAGLQDENMRTPALTMNPLWGRAVSYYALSLLDRPLCSCDGLRAFTEHWAMDLSVRSGNQASSISYNLSRGILNNPLGTTRAAMHAWRLIQRHTVGEGV